MVQRQKPEVREAILESAFKQFSKNGYAKATIPQIATGAKMSPANFYVYFSSKLDVLLALYEPWLQARLEKLEIEVEQIEDPRQAICRILTVLWREIPSMNNGFSTNIMQALSVGTRAEGYDPHVIIWAESKISGMLRRTLASAGLPSDDTSPIAHVLFMAFDGFSLNFHLNPWAVCSDEAIAVFADLLLSRRALQPEGQAAADQPVQIFHSGA